MSEDKPKYSKEEIDSCINLLDYMVNNEKDFVALPREKQIELLKLAGQLSRPDKEQKKQRRKEAKTRKKQKIDSAERSARAATGIRVAREAKVFCAPLQISDTKESSEKNLVISSFRNCYVCKATSFFL